MLTTFIIQIDKAHPFPFDGPKPAHIRPLVRVEYHSNDQHVLLEIGRKIERLLNLRSRGNVKPSRIKEIRRKGYVIDYEYIG